jgi:hypothetical protein
MHGRSGGRANIVFAHAWSPQVSHYTGLYARLCTGPRGAVIGLAGGRWHRDDRDW